MLCSGTDLAQRVIQLEEWNDDEDEEFAFVTETPRLDEQEIGSNDHHAEGIRPHPALQQGFEDRSATYAAPAQREGLDKYLIANADLTLAKGQAPAKPKAFASVGEDLKSKSLTKDPGIHPY